jgi:hypothetical protein
MTERLPVKMQNGAAFISSRQTATGGEAARAATAANAPAADAKPSPMKEENK